MANTDSPQTLSPEQTQLGEEPLHFENLGLVSLDKVIRAGDTDKYYAQVRHHKNPAIRLLRGHGGGAVAGVSYIRSWSKTYHIGLGDDEVSMHWVDLTYAVALQKKVVFSWEGETYALTRESQDESGDDLKHAKLWTHFKVTQESTAQRLALYVTDKGWGKKKAALRLARGMSPELEILIILAICSWLEEMRRAG